MASAFLAGPRKQFDVCTATVGPSRNPYCLVVVLQHPHVDQLGTLVVAPLYLAKDLPLVTHVRFTARIDRKSYVVAVDRVAAIPAKDLEKTITNLDKHRDQFSRAWDLLFFGF